MDPPPYSELESLEGLDWNAIASKITTDRISPRDYYALQILVRENTEDFVGMTELVGRTRGLWVNIIDLKRAYVFWKILHIFDESEYVNEIQLIEEFLSSDAGNLDMFLRYRGYEARQGTAAEAYRAFRIGNRVLRDLNLTEYY